MHARRDIGCANFSDHASSWRREDGTKVNIRKLIKTKSWSFASKVQDTHVTPQMDTSCEVPNLIRGDKTAGNQFSLQNRTTNCYNALKDFVLNGIGVEMRVS